MITNSADRFADIARLTALMRDSDKRVAAMSFDRYQLQKAIRVMEDVKARGYGVNMTAWYTDNEGDPICKDSICTIDASDHHKCGNTACFAGWLALSPEWREFFGQSVFPDSHTVAQFLSNTDPNTNNHIHPSVSSFASNMVLGARDADGLYSTFYDKSWAKVDVNDVLAKLYEQRNKVNAVVTGNNW